MPGSVREKSGSCMYSMYGHTYSKSKDQPGKVANPARGQLIREDGNFFGTGFLPSSAAASTYNICMCVIYYSRKLRISFMFSCL